MCRALWRDLGLADRAPGAQLPGQAASAAPTARRWVAHLEPTATCSTPTPLAPGCTGNPLRILRHKNPAMQPLSEAAPKLMALPGRGVAQALRRRVRCARRRPARPTRVTIGWWRGMDYYALTVFEWITDRLGAQGTVCGGGRYERLAELIGGKPAPGIRLGLGIERVLDLLQQAGTARRRRCPTPTRSFPTRLRCGGGAGGRGAARRRRGGADACRRRSMKGPVPACRHQRCTLGAGLRGDELSQAWWPSSRCAMPPRRRFTRPLSDAAAWAVELLKR